ncbi:MAG: hypothetical protein PHZ03_06405 [Syntrophomonas sp.]|nr:hypothetical protein [Syntrophomonas sp.]
MKKITTILLCVFLCASILVSGCGKTTQKPLVPENQPNTQMNTPQQTNDAEKRVMANRFSNLAMGVNGVQKATVVVSATDSGMAGNTVTPSPTSIPGSSAIGEKLVVMVGLNLDTKIMQDKTKEMSIKDEVKSKIMADNQMVSEVLLTSNPDMIKKLQDVAAGVIQGKPMQSYAQDVEELNKNIRAQ